MHTHVAPLWALLEYAQVAGDEYRKDFALFGYGRTRNRGISCIGCFIWTTEVCATFGNDCAGGEAVVVRGRRLLGRC